MSNAFEILHKKGVTPEQVMQMYEKNPVRLKDIAAELETSVETIRTFLMLHSFDRYKEIANSKNILLRKKKASMKTKLTSITQPVQQDDLPEMTIEQYLVYIARISSSNRVNNETAPRLINYCIKHGHWSPFEMVDISFEIKTSRAIAAQFLRHRSFSFQEFSQRYAEVTNCTKVELRKQSENNRQSSTDVMHNETLQAILKASLDNSFEAYHSLIEQGVAREVARMVLPLATETTLVMKGSLRSWITFFMQRCSEHAQKEAQEIAYEIRDKLKEHFPATAEALEW